MLHLRLLVLADGGIGFSFCVLRGERKIACLNMRRAMIVIRSLVFTFSLLRSTWNGFNSFLSNSGSAVLPLVLRANVVPGCVVYNYYLDLYIYMFGRVSTWLRRNIQSLVLTYRK